MKIKVCKDGIDFISAINLLCGKITLESFTEADRAQIDLNNIADEIIIADGKYVLNEVLSIDKPLKITNIDGVIDLQGMAFLRIASSNVYLEGLKFNGGLLAINVDGSGKEIENIYIERCSFKGYLSAGILTGSTISNSLIKNINIIDNEFESGLMPGEDPIWGSATPISIFAALTMQPAKVSNAIVDGAYIKGNKLSGINRAGIAGMIGADLTQGNQGYFDNCHIRNLAIENNDIAGVGDTSLAVQTEFYNHTNCTIENVDFINNRIDVGIYGISVCAGCPMSGESHDVKAKNINIIGNELHSRHPGEPDYAIFVSSAVLVGDVSKVYDSVLENVQVKDNTIIGFERGIVLCGANGNVDSNAPSIASNNVLKNVLVDGNKIKDTNWCFVIAGAWLEGRRFDWNFSYYHDEKKWDEYIRDHRTKTVIAEKNRIEDLTVSNNICDGFRYFIAAAGAIGRGHAVMNDNEVVKNIEFKNNHITNGENHQIVNDYIFEDWITGEGNKLDESIKYDGFIVDITDEKPLF